MSRPKQKNNDQTLPESDVQEQKNDDILSDFVL